MDGNRRAKPGTYPFPKIIAPVGTPTPLETSTCSTLFPG